MLSRSSLRAALLGVLLAAGLAAQTADTYKRVADKIVCQCGCSYPLDTCPHTDCPWAPKIRAGILEQVTAGKTEEEILAGLVAQYGQVILAAPPPRGFNLVGWIMPFAALVLGIWIVRRIVLVWRARRPAPQADPGLVDRYRQTIEKELKRLEEV